MYTKTMPSTTHLVITVALLLVHVACQPQDSKDDLIGTDGRLHHNHQWHRREITSQSSVAQTGDYITFISGTDGRLHHKKETVRDLENGVLKHQTIHYRLDDENRGEREMTSLTPSSCDLYERPVRAKKAPPSSSGHVQALKTATSFDSVRQNKQVYHIDVVAVVDYKAYTRFLDEAENRPVAMQNLLEYYQFVIAGVDLLYQAIPFTNYSIRIHLGKVVVAEEPSASPFTENHIQGTFVNGSLALDSFAQFLAGNGSLLVSPYDAAILFSGYDLYSKDGEDIVGLSNVGTLCNTDGSSSSLVEDLGGFQCIDTAAHELGHVLNAQNDEGEDGCSSDDHYIMADVGTLDKDRRTTNPWKFSSCSIDSFREFFSKLQETSDGTACLTGQLPRDSNLADLKGNLPGLKFHADVQCKMLVGEESTDCSGESGRDFDKDPSLYCRSLWCQNSDSQSCDDFVPVPGTPCDGGKLCINGECVRHPLAPGQQANRSTAQCDSTNDVDINCTLEVASYPWMCYSEVFKRHCCESCLDIYYPIQDCQFGDWRSNCGLSDCNGSLMDRWQCCETCSSGHLLTTRLTSSISGDSLGPSTTTSATSTNFSVTTTPPHPAKDNTNVWLVVSCIQGVTIVSFVIYKIISYMQSRGFWASLRRHFFSNPDPLVEEDVLL